MPTPDDIIPGGTDLLERNTASQEKPKRPPMWRAVLINDDETPAEFVIHILLNVFVLPAAEAGRIMMRAHQNGRAVVVITTREVVETKVTQANATSQMNGFPLTLAAERDE